jgi:hypothetical protein
MKSLRRRLAVFVATGVLAAGLLAALAGGASADYGPGAVYQVEITANDSGPTGGGIWLWIALNRSSTGDYRGSDCGHGFGAARDSGDVTTWSSSGGWLTISGVVLHGFGPFPVPVTITVPSTYGHYAYPTNAFTSIFTGLPTFLAGLGHAQVQIAP